MKPVDLSANYGSTNPFPSAPLGGGTFSVTQNVQLVSARVVRPLAWAIMLQPVTRSDFRSTVPWQTAFASGTLGLNPTTPNIPRACIGGYKVKLTWGAGGVRGDAVFDYPMAGGVFGLFGDTVDLSVFVPTGQPTTVYPDQGSIPVFGAFMVPGTSTGSVRLTDVEPDAATAVGSSRQWAVKPYAKALWVSSAFSVGAGLYAVEFLNSAGALLWGTQQGQDAGSSNEQGRPIPVPPQATTVRLTNISGGAGMLWSLMWDIGLSG